MKKRLGFTLIELPVVRKRGFTLIELLVVLTIIGILASLVIINVSNARKSGRDAKRVANLKSIQTALEMYAEKNGGYPVTFTRVATGTPGAVDVTLDGTTTTLALIRSGCSIVATKAWCGLSGKYNTAGNTAGTAGFQSSGSTGWIPNLAPDFIPVLPTDPRWQPSLWTSTPTNQFYEFGYIYKSDGIDYSLKAKQSMETCPSTGCKAAENVSIKEMVAPREQTTTEATIAVWSSGASGW